MRLLHRFGTKPGPLEVGELAVILEEVIRPDTLHDLDRVADVLVPLREDMGGARRGEPPAPGLLRLPAAPGDIAWSPDGRQIVFTSDRGGRPQLYRYGLADRSLERLTFEGNYNARACYSPDGQLLAFVHGEKGRYRIAIMDLSNGGMQLVSDGPLDESPSFAPNGSMVIYATEYQGRGVLAAVSVDGRVRQRLVLQGGDAREPRWSPYLQ